MPVFTGTTMVPSSFPSLEPVKPRLSPELIENGTRALFSGLLHDFLVALTAWHAASELDTRPQRLKELS